MSLKQTSFRSVLVAFLAAGTLVAQDTPQTTPTPEAGQTTTTTTQSTVTTPADSTTSTTQPLTKEEIKRQRQQQKHEEKASSASAKAAKREADAKKLHDKATQEQEKSVVPQ